MPLLRSQASRKFSTSLYLPIGVLLLLGLAATAHAAIILGQPNYSFSINPNPSALAFNSTPETAATSTTLGGLQFFYGDQTSGIFLPTQNLEFMIVQQTGGTGGCTNAPIAGAGYAIWSPLMQAYVLTGSKLGTWTGTNYSGCNGYPIVGGDTYTLQLSGAVDMNSYPWFGWYTANGQTQGASTATSDVFWQAADGGGFPLNACMNVVSTTTTISSNIAVNTTWNANQTYVISGSVAVNSGSTLKILPCSVIKFATATSTLTVNGVLDAEGTSSPIYFTSYKDDTVGGDTNGDGASSTPAAGNWRNIIVGSTGSTTLSNVIARYGGNGGGSTNSEVYDNGGTLFISNSTMATSSAYGVGFAGGTFNLASSTLNNNSYSAAYQNLTSGGTFTHWNTTNSGNTVNGITVSGTIGSNQEWKKDKTVSPIPYVVSGIVTISAGKTLTVDPGVVIKFNSNSSGLGINGILLANGLANPSTGIDNKIFFTSLYDNSTLDTATNSTTTPSAGDWQDITINSGATANISDAVIRYGGHIATSTSGALLNNSGGSVTVGASSTIAYSSDYGIKNTAGTTTVFTTDLGYNNYGLYLSGGSASITASSTIHNNSLYGVYNSTLATTTATGNYWGDNSGPYNSLYNSSGLGNAVSNQVSFYPFIGGTSTTTQIHYLDHVTAVSGSELTYTTSTGYVPELNAATTTWNSFGPIQIVPATTTPLIPNITIYDYNDQDVPEVGRYSPTGTTSIVALNSYFLKNNTFAQIQNTITHELGHALGLDHSFTGNIMYFNQTSQINLGSQDQSDYNCLWVSKACPQH